MKVPEKVYIDDFGSGFSHGWHTEHSYEKDIEYIRKDAFVEKAEKFLKSYRRETPDKTGYISGIVDDKMIEDFKKYMEE